VTLRQKTLYGRVATVWRPKIEESVKSRYMGLRQIIRRVLLLFRLLDLLQRTPPQLDNVLICQDRMHACMHDVDDDDTAASVEKGWEGWFYYKV